MRIQLSLLVPLFLLFLTNIWEQLFPSSQFLQSSCVTGTISLGQLTQITQCSSCYSYPLYKHQIGKIEIREGSPQELKQVQKKQKKEKIWVSLYYQESCIEYECAQLLNPSGFKNGGILEEAELTELVQYSKFIGGDVWQVQIDYDNHVKGQTKRTLFQNFVVAVFGSFIPNPLLPHHELYYGMAIRFRYTQPIPQQPTLTFKPIIKMTTIQTSQTFQLLALSLIIFYTLILKLGLHCQKKLHSLYLFTLVLTFISPYLFSLLCLVIFVLKRPMHLIGLGFMVIALALDFRSFITLTLVACCGVQFWGGGEEVGLLDFVWVCIISTLAVLLDIQSIYSSALVLLYIICLQDKTKQYQKLHTKQSGIQLKQYEPMVYHQ